MIYAPKVRETLGCIFYSKKDKNILDVLAWIQIICFKICEKQFRLQWNTDWLIYFFNLARWSPKSFSSPKHLHSETLTPPLYFLHENDTQRHAHIDIRHHIPCIGYKKQIQATSIHILIKDILKTETNHIILFEHLKITILSEQKVTIKYISVFT